jgi:hypothetical protein
VTPVQGTCCSGSAPDSDGDERCDNTTDYWNGADVGDLSFQMTDQHYFTTRSDRTEP